MAWLADSQRSFRPRSRIRCRSQCGAWRIITSVERKEIYDGVVALMDEPVVLQRQAPVMQEVLNTVEFPQEQHVDEIGDVLVVAQSKVPVVRTVQKAVEVPQVQSRDRVVDVPVLFVKEGIIEVAQQGSQELDVPVTHGRVFIMDDCDELIPVWLNVVKGVVDSVDLPLNISREILQQNEILRVIKKNRVKKRLDMLAEIAELNDDHKMFYEQFVICTKPGTRENSVNDVEIAKLCGFNTSKSRNEQVSFKEHVFRMKEGQNDIYHITGESIVVVSSLSFRENLRMKGYEVLYVAGPVDEYAVYQFKGVDGTKLKPTMKEGLDFWRS